MIIHDLREAPALAGIYKFRNKLNNKIYIGKTNNLKTRLKSYLQKSTSRPIIKAIEKYGIDNFEIKILQTFDSINNNEILALETAFIDFYKSHQDGYNICLFSNDRTGVKTPQSVKEKQRKSATGRKMPEDLKRKLSMLKTGENHPNWGKHHSVETIEKMRLSKIGKKSSQETKHKISKNHSKSQRKNVIQIDPITHVPIKIWDSMIDAALYFGGKNQNTISRACWTQLNKPSPHKAFGYLWNYKSE